MDDLEYKQMLEREKAVSDRVRLALGEKAKATELEYLQWFYSECDFGPAHGDVVQLMEDNFRKETGKGLPEGYVQSNK